MKMVLKTIYHSTIVCIALLTTAVTAVGQGPKVVTKNTAGAEIFDLGNQQLTVVDYDLPRFSTFPMRPTLVYNCAKIPSICKNAAKWAGYLPTNLLPLKLHFDPDSGRKDARRAVACPDGWANALKADGSPNCPESDQPKWVGYNNDGVKFGPFPVKVHVLGNTRNRLTKTWQKITFNADGTYTNTREYMDYGAVMSCDEFPAATFIEGGGAGNNVKAATEYCAPLRQACVKKTQVPHEKALTTDQDMQGASHNYLRSLLILIHKNIDNTGSGFASKIYTFNFYTVNDESIAHGAWVEANGVKRYCAGIPGSSKTNGCSNTLRPGIDIP